MKHAGTPPRSARVSSGLALAALFLTAAPAPGAPPDDTRAALLDEAEQGDLEQVSYLLDAGAPVDARGPDLSTPLMRAALNGQLAVASALLNAGADVNARDRSNASALHWGVPHPAVARILLEHGADPDAKAASGYTPLIVATLSDAMSETVRLLLDRGASVQLATPSGFTPLMSATNGSAEVVELLLQRGADPNVETSIGWTALHGAATSGDARMVRALLAHGAKPDARERSGGTTPLMWAAAAQTPAALRLLLAKGVNVGVREKLHGNSALGWAAAEGQAEAVQLLLAAHAEVDGLDLDGQTAADWARRSGDAAARAALPGGPHAATLEASPPARPAPSLRVGIERSLALLQKAGPSFIAAAPGHCVSCHHQSLPAMAFALARVRGFAVDGGNVHSQVAATLAELAPRTDRLRLGVGTADPLDAAYLLVGLKASGAPADETTEALVHYLVLRQQQDGRWRSLLHRPPMDDSDITSTALSLRAIQSYAPAARSQEISARVSRGADWLVAAHPRNTEESSLRLLGLSWGEKAAELMTRAAVELRAQQRQDGGWAQTPGASSDAYATGEALVALLEAGRAGAGDSAVRRGVQYLRATQQEDGSWRVANRSLPVQSYFESGFPHGRAQFISCAATAWATMALLLTVPERR